jgi:hypothetical protein
VANFPDHPPSNVTHVCLAEVESLFASGQTSQELTGEDTAIIAIFLLGSVLWMAVNEEVLTKQLTKTVQG